jgi:hypothetical protein
VIPSDSSDRKFGGACPVRRSIGAARSARAHEHVVVAAEAALDRAARLQPLRLGRAGEHGERRGRDEDPEQQRERAAAAVHELAHDDAPHA